MNRTATEREMELPGVVTHPVYADIGRPNGEPCETWYWDSEGLVRQRYDAESDESVIVPDRKLRGVLAMGRVELQSARGSVRPLVGLSDEQRRDVLEGISGQYPGVDWYWFDSVDSRGELVRARPEP